MKSIRHHPGVSCYEHSVFVSYVPGIWADRWGADARTAARAGLLHDLYLLRPPAPCPPTGSALPIRSPPRRMRRAVWRPDRPGEKLHFGPHVALSRRAPRSREAAAVCLADKLCATAEIMQIWRNLGLRRAVLSGA